jgi:type IV pilus assembly protein PilA
MKQIQKGFTLIELMIVVAIIGILAAVAIPAYNDYIARAQVSEAVSLMSGGKTPMAEYYADKGEWPSTASDVMGNTSGKYTSAITITAGASLPTIVTLTARMKDASINASITSKTVTLSSTDGKTWLCQTGDIDAKFVPGACK